MYDLKTKPINNYLIGFICASHHFLLRFMNHFVLLFHTYYVLGCYYHFSLQPLHIISFFLEPTPKKNQLKVKDYIVSSEDDSDNGSHWKPKTNSIFDKSNLNNLL